MSWHTFWWHDVLSILFDVMNYFPYFLMSWTTLHTFWRYDIFNGIVIYFLTSWCTCNAFWCHDILFDVMTYFPYFLRSQHTFWRHSVLSILFDVMYFPYFWHHNYYIPCILTSWLILSQHEVLFDVITYFLYFWRHDVLSIPFDVMM